MTTFYRSRSAASRALALAGLVAVLISSPTASQAADTTGQAPFAQDGTAPPASHDLIQGSHVEGHIAFLKAELGITPQQENLWEPVADAMRQDVKNLDDAELRVESQTKGRLSAIEYLQNRVVFAKLRGEGEERFLSALRPLYDSLSKHQRMVADSLLIPDEQN